MRSIVVVVLSASSQNAGPYEISWCTIDGGGGTSNSGQYKLTGTIGQPDTDWSGLIDDVRIYNRAITP